MAVSVSIQLLFFRLVCFSAQPFKRLQDVQSQLRVNWGANSRGFRGMGIKLFTRTHFHIVQVESGKQMNAVLFNKSICSLNAGITCGSHRSKGFESKSLHRIAVDLLIRLGMGYAEGLVAIGPPVLW